MAHSLIIVSRRYNGHEVWTALGVIQERGHSFEVVSTGLIIEDEKTRRRNTIERLVYDVTLDELESYDGVMVISGDPGDTTAYWTDKHVQNIIRRAHELDLAIAGICVGVPTIRLAANGKRVSAFPLVPSLDLLHRAGATVTTVTVTVDGKLVTAEHQMATQMWAEEFCNVLEGKPPSYSFTDSGYTPGRPMPEHRVPKALRAVQKRVRNRKLRDL